MAKVYSDEEVFGKKIYSDEEVFGKSSKKGGGSIPAPASGMTADEQLAVDAVNGTFSMDVATGLPSKKMDYRQEVLDIFNKLAPKSKNKGMTADEQLAVDALSMEYKDTAFDKAMSKISDSKASKYIEEKIVGGIEKAGTGLVTMPLDIVQDAVNNGPIDAAYNFGKGTLEMAGQGIGLYDPQTGKWSSDPVQALGSILPGVSPYFDASTRVLAKNYADDPINSIFGAASIAGGLAGGIKKGGNLLDRMRKAEAVPVDISGPMQIGGANPLERVASQGVESRIPRYENVDKFRQELIARRTPPKPMEVAMETVRNDASLAVDRKVNPVAEIMQKPEWMEPDGVMRGTANQATVWDTKGTKLEGEVNPMQVMRDMDPEVALSKLEPAFKEPPQSNMQKVFKDVMEENIAKHNPPKPENFDSMIPNLKGGSTSRPGAHADGSAINYSKYETTTDVLNTMKDIVKRADIEKVPVTWDQTLKAAQETGMTPAKLREIYAEKGQLGAVEVVAARLVNLEGVERITNAIKELPYDVTKMPETLKAELREAITIAKITSEAATKAGQTLETFKHKVGTQDQINMQKIAEIMGGGPIEKVQLRAFGPNKVTEAILSPAREAVLFEKLKKLDTSNPRAVNEFISGATRSKMLKLSDAANEWRLNAMLSNPKTHIVNLTSNATMIASHILEKGVAATLDFGRSKFTGKPREVFYQEGIQALKHVHTDMTNAIRFAADEFKTGSNFSKMDPTYATSALPQKVSRFTPLEMLGTEDALSKGYISSMKIRMDAVKVAKKEGLSGKKMNARVDELIAEPTAKMMDLEYRRSAEFRATPEGRLATDLTLQSDLGAMGEALMKAREYVPGGKLIVPFVKTPVNAGKWFIDRTPYGGYKALKGLLDGSIPWEKASMDLAKPIIGAGIGLAIYQLAQAELITGGRPRDSREAAEASATGWKPYSLHIGDKYIDLSRFEPVAPIIIMAADARDTFRQMRKDTVVDTEARTKLIFNRMLEKIDNAMISRSFVTGIKDVMDAIQGGIAKNDWWTSTGKLGTKIATSYVPGALRPITQATDGIVRDPDGFLDAFKVKIPGFSQEVAPKLSVWGREQTTSGDALANSFSPLGYSKEEGGLVEKEMRDLDYSIDYPDRTITVGKQKIKLTKDEYWEMVRDARLPAREQVEKLMMSSMWQMFNKEQRGQAVKRIVSSCTKKARDRIAIQKYREGGLGGASVTDIWKLEEHQIE